MTDWTPYDWCGLDHYDRVRRRDATGAFEWVTVLPDDPAPVHSVRKRLDHPDCVSFPHHWETARCGARVKVMLPTLFDRDDPDACQECAEA